MAEHAYGELGIIVPIYSSIFFLSRQVKRAFNGMVFFIDESFS